MENKIGKTKSCIHLYLNVHLLIFNQTSIIEMKRN